MSDGGDGGQVEVVCRACIQRAGLGGEGKGVYSFSFVGWAVGVCERRLCDWR